MRKGLLSVAIILLTTMLLAACGSGGSSEGTASTEGGVFKVGMECGYPPFNWTQMDDSNGAVKIEGNAEYAADMMWK